MEHKYQTLRDKLADHQFEREELHQELMSQKRALQLALRRTFGSQDGKLVLAHLDSMFRRREILVPGDSVSTHVRVGERNVIEYIMKALENEVEHVRTEEFSEEP